MMILNLGRLWNKMVYFVLEDKDYTYPGDLDSCCAKTSLVSLMSSDRIEYL